MCGIVGIRRYDGEPVSEGLLREMANQLVHRGPDEEGAWLGDFIGFGHRRLSIINPEGSHQPMSAGSLHTCFNGEIFNYADLRKNLSVGGWSFRTEGDTEVLLASFAAAGAEGVQELDGQFAFAIYDEDRGDLWLFRDRMGILPLYYYWDGKVFLFASEVKALLPALPGGAAVDEDSVREYLGFRSVPAPHSLFRNVRKLEPGHRLRLDRRGELYDDAYWSLPTSASVSDTSPEQAVECVSTALEQAVESRLVADVPVGALLSGGVDSSLIAALVSQLRDGGRVKTYAAGFDDPRFDERPFAAQVSRQLRTDHHEVSVRPEDFSELWPTLTWHRDAPISEPSDIAIFQLARTASESVKVLLSGEGSDELFAGYPKYRFRRWAGLADFVPSSLRRPLFETLERRLPHRLARLRIMMRAMGEPSEADRFQAWFAPFTSAERQRLLPGAERGGYASISGCSDGDLLQRMLYTDCHVWLVDNLLERGDRMSMAASVELRPPFLDHKLVEVAFSLPSNLKIRKGVTKWVVKEVARRHLPAEIVDRRKVGFRVPLDAWFRGGLREMAEDMLLSPNSFVGELMNRVMVEELLASHRSGRRDESNRLWTLLGLEIWHERFFRNGS